MPTPRTEEERRRENDIVLVALARPPMVYGMPYLAFLGAAGASFPALVLAARITGHPGWTLLSMLIVAVLTLGGFRALTAWSVHFARRIALAIEAAFADLSGLISGGTTTGPHRAGLPASERDIPHAI